MSEVPNCVVTDHFMSQKIVGSFAQGIKKTPINIKKIKDYSKPLATYGILRGTEDLFHKAKIFYYIDHGYLNSSKRIFEQGKTFIDSLDGYFRIVKNDFFHSGKGNCKSDRFEKLNIQIKEKRNFGEFILLSEPSIYVKKFFQLEDWVNKTIVEISKYTDRKIYVHNKQSKVSLDLLLNKAWAFVSDQSTAGFKAMLAGVPAHFTNKTLKGINSIKEIENGNINVNTFYNLAYGQWTLKEMQSGEAWEYIKKFN